MGNPNMIMSLAGNKADLSEQRAVPSEDAKVCPSSSCQRSCWIKYAHKQYTNSQNISNFTAPSKAVHSCLMSVLNFCIDAGLVFCI